MTRKEIMAVQALAAALLAAIKDAGFGVGAPGGVLYAGVMGKVSLSQFEQVISQLVGRGFLRKKFELYWITESGREFLAKLEAAA